MITATKIAGMGIHYRYFSRSYMLEAQKSVGFSSIELYCGEPHIHISSEGIADEKEVIKDIKDSGLQVICVTPDNCMSPWQYAVRGDTALQETKRYFLSTLDLALTLQCPRVACHSGWGMRNESEKEAWLRSLHFFEWYAEQAADRGIILVMESLREQESNLVNSLPRLKRYLKELDHPSVQPMIDTCAMAVAGETLEDWFNAFEGNIQHLHFIDGTPYGHLVWGDGNRSLTDYIETLNKFGYQGYLTQELTDNRYYVDPKEADKKSFKAICQQLD
ncbi:sugar phosphate isomerase/epimerase family protein [Kallipyga gabonensis]|uniref:sugar phosphate isomerase/epimerase family protein n=1 Tax=Kallipyga gabonensis TaxID=1686287 RepID=UPI0006B4CB0E|nr:sugar phosphate isomerase/epimerase family protein [Kallipyga gabonensis]